MPTAAAITAAFTAGGFAAAGGAEVVEALRTDGTRGAEWVEAMRDRDTLLGALTDEELEATKASLAARGDEVQPPGILTVLAFRR